MKFDYLKDSDVDQKRQEREHPTIFVVSGAIIRM